MVMEPLIVVALVILLFGAISRRAERSPLTPPMFFIAAGWLVSEHGLGLLHVDVSGSVIHTLAEITLVVVLFTDASRIDLACLRREESLPLRLLGVGMPLTILIGTAAGIALLPGFSWVELALVAAILAPTDAALGQAVVSNPLVPLRIRQSLNVESGLNDGIALPIVLFLAAMAGATGGENSASHWLRTAALAVTLGPAVGVAVGWAGGLWLERGVASGWVNIPFERLSSLGLAFLAFSGAEFIGGNGFIAAFVAGLTLGNVGKNVCETLHEFGETEGQLLTLLVFLVFGAVMVPSALAQVSVSTLVYALLSLTMVRMIPVALSLLGTGLGTPSVAFLGWFGPRGLASILFALVVVEEGRLASGPQLEGVVVLTVLLSAILHGATAYPFARRYGAHAEEGERRELAKETIDLPVRVRHS
ncbi:MAG: cation:proton antiporter [Deltaproteobacteria bacterium]|nr:cation:proton antiporter [Deltaproteobacteria bacterium]MBW2394854.1 cation:proton antiporter [Deltaproteobacteria bacterium]